MKLKFSFEKLKKKKNLKKNEYENCTHLIVSNNKNCVCTKFILIISIL